MSDILTGKIRRLPPWPRVRAIVEACRDGAAANERSLPPDLADPEAWRSRYFDLEQDLDVPQARGAGGLAALLQEDPGEAEGGAADIAKSLSADDAGLDARVHRAVSPIPYVHRDVEDDVSAHVRSGLPVLLVGPSMVGKTRMAATVISDALAGRRVIIPGDRSALARLGTACPAVVGCVIFLDDIDRLIGADGITQAAFRCLAEQNVVIGTIRAGVYDQLQPTDQLRPPEWDVLDTFRRVFVERPLNGAEQDRLAEAVPDSGMRQRILQVGIGEYVGAAERVAEALRLGPSVSPAGFALVLGAADWSRAGMNAPVPGRLLLELAFPHIDARGRLGLESEDGYGQALSWAVRTINPTVSLLQPEPGDAFSVYDYALDLIAVQGEPVPPPTWPVLISNASPAALVRIGRVAQEQEQHRAAEQAWRRCEDTSDAQAAPYAALFLGDHFKERGEIERARVEFQRAVDSGHPTAAAVAAHNLGLLLQEQDDFDGAWDAYERAVKSGHPDAYPLAVLGIGNVLIEQGRLDEARTAYQLAIDSGHAEATPIAAFNLGNVLRQQGDLEGARIAYQQGADSADPEVMRKAAVNLGALLGKQGDLDGAKAAYRSAIESGDPEVTLKAALSLGNLLAAEGDRNGACAARRQAIDSGLGSHEPMAALAVGVLLEESGDLDGAKAAYRSTIDSSDPSAALKATFSLGKLLDEQGDIDGARAVYQQAIDSGHTIEPTAARSLGKRLTEHGDLGRARVAYQSAIGSGDPDAAPMGAYELGVLLTEHGDADGAQGAFQQAIDSGHPDARPMGALGLANLLKDKGDVDGARVLYRQAIDCRHADTSPAAAVNLAILLDEQGDTTSAVAAFQLAIDSGHAEQSPKGLVGLGVLLAEKDDADGARAAFRQAAGSANQDIASLARRLLDGLR